MGRPDCSEGDDVVPKLLVGRTPDGWRFAITDGCGNFCSAGNRDFKVIDDVDFSDAFEWGTWVPQELIDEAEQWSDSEIEYLQYGHSAFEDKAIDILQKIVESVRRYRDDEQG